MPNWPRTGRTGRPSSLTGSDKLPADPGAWCAPCSLRGEGEDPREQKHCRIIAPLCVCGPCRVFRVGRDGAGVVRHAAGVGAGVVRLTVGTGGVFHLAMTSVRSIHDTPYLDESGPGLITVTSAAAFGMDPQKLPAAHKAGTLVRIRRGAYTIADRHLDPRQRHLAHIEAARELLKPDTVFSHVSAAVLLGLDVPWNLLTEQIHVTRGPSGGSRRPKLITHTGPIPQDQWTVVEGLRVTTLARTAVDIARYVELRYSMPVLDHVLRWHGGPAMHAQLRQLCDRLRRRVGIVRARKAIAFADGRAETGGESTSRVVLASLSLPRPELQYEVVDRRGDLVARCDFAWPELRTVGEFDGKVKYREVAEREGLRPSEMVIKEKMREDTLRALGWEVVRWTYDDLAHPDRLAGQLRAAFDRGTARR